MKNIVMTYDLAMAIMKDTANASMRKAGRSKWSRADYNAGVKAFERCLPNPLDCRDSMAPRA